MIKRVASDLLNSFGHWELEICLCFISLIFVI